ncbi:MAG: leucine--tRNA ligase [Candidatus Campbellbacteria bacterium]|nr:leucine--tRNA ligase [Candidatus Campbellbacteria bacterium]
MYSHKDIEEKFNKKWEEGDIYATPQDDKKETRYVLDMFPYPSGDGLHVGHTRGYIASDVYSRFLRMNNFAVLHPMGWDAFGLPAENRAIETNTHPREEVDKNTAMYKSQLKKIGLSYDWSREIDTTDENYYKWTQWIFLQFYKKGLAYRANAPVNWCPSCQTVLANEDLEDKKCERCKTPILKKDLCQWFLKITQYADRLLNDLDKLKNWPSHVVELQRNWIGKSEGYEFRFSLFNEDGGINVFTTRADTIMGVTYLALSPEHPLVRKILPKVNNKEEVEWYIKKAGQMDEAIRTDKEREKTGVLVKGLRASHPVTNNPIPIFIADYILSDYGTGAIMGVPAHDERDYNFAKRYDIPVVQVISSEDADENKNECYTGKGLLVNSGEFNGLSSEVASSIIAERINGVKTSTYKLKDWVFSRQRYWGEPIPIVYCDDEVVPVPEEDLPLLLPNVKNYQPTGTGESPLANIDEWVNTTCPKIDGKKMSACRPAKRETDTMPGWAGSSWYYLRFIDPNNKKSFVGKKKEKSWMPVSVYVGGLEHATRHLIYARFWHKVLYDLGLVSTEEPFDTLRPVGLIHAQDGKKMGKRYSNGTTPDEVVESYGADALRMYVMFIAPFNQTALWNSKGINGTRRFLERVWKMKDSVSDSAKPSENLETQLHEAIRKIKEDIEKFHFNTAVSQMMIFANAMDKEKKIPKSIFETFLKLLAPFCPYLTEEIWLHLGHKKSIHLAEWPKYDSKKIVVKNVPIVIQVNGKMRATESFAPDTSQSEVEKKAKKIPNVAVHIKKGEPTNVIFVPNKVINFVLK